MAGYIGSGASVVSSGAENKKVFDITTNTTSLTGLNYTVGKVHVYHNGVRLVDGTDYTATNSTSIALTVAAVSGDQVVVVSFASFQLSEHYTSAEADAEFLNDPNGAITIDGGNVGIGDSPLSILHVGTGSDANVPITFAPSTGGNIEFRNTSSTGSFSITNGNGSSEKLRIDASGKVGIGTSSPDAPLDVTRSGDGTIAIFQNTGNHGFEFSAPSSTALQIASKQGSKNLDLWANTLSFSAGGSQRMDIDASGRVTKPSQPAFQAYNTNNGAFTASAGGTFPLNATVFNIGNCFNTSNYTFTAPVDGYYQLDFMTISTSSQGNIHLDFNFSGNSNMGKNFHFSGNSSGDWDTLSMSGVYYMSAGVSVSVRNSTYNITVHGSTWNKFTGYLLG